MVQRLGQVGYPAKGAAFAVVGGLLGYAALTVDPSQSTGLDGAMRTILQAPFGQVLLTWSRWASPPSASSASSAPATRSAPDAWRSCPLR